jgi:protein phosphatase
VREGNEDRFLVREQRGTLLLAVADGVGGSSGGEVAADAALNELGTRFFAASADRAPSDALAEAIREANAAVLRTAESSGQRDAASTLVALAIRGGEATVANLGDSRAYLVRDGECRQLTQDHSGAMAHAITRFVGDPRGVQPDVFVETLRDGDRLLLCSDGLTRHVTSEEIARTVARDDPQVAADALVDLANARGGQDNVTVVLHAPATRRALVPLPGGGAVALALFVLLLLVTVGGTFAVLIASRPATTPIPSAAPTAEPSPTPTATPSATETPTGSPTPTATP